MVPEIASSDCIELRLIFDEGGRTGGTICGAKGWGLTGVVSFVRFATIPCSCDKWVLMLSRCSSLRVDMVSSVQRLETKQRVLAYYLFDINTR
jgi:hypothetical protein